MGVEPPSQNMMKNPMGAWFQDSRVRIVECQTMELHPPSTSHGHFFPPPPAHPSDFGIYELWTDKLPCKRCKQPERVVPLTPVHCQLTRQLTVWPRVPEKILGSVCARMFSCIQFFETPWTVLLCPCDFPTKNTGVGCHFILQWIFPTQGLNPCLLCLLHCREILYH